MATWPSTLPHFSIGMTEARQQGFIRTSMDTGPAKQRRRFSAVSRVLEGSMILTEAQRATFDTFYGTTISEGSDSFTFEDPKDFSDQSARFIAPPTYTALVQGATGVALYEVSLQIEILP